MKFYRIVTVYGWINKMLQSFSFRGRPVLLGGEAELAHYEIIAVLSNSFYGEYQPACSRLGLTIHISNAFRMTIQSCHW